MSQALFGLHKPAYTKHNVHRGYTPVIVSYPRTVAPLNRTRLDKAHVHRRVCKRIMNVLAIVVVVFPFS